MTAGATAAPAVPALEVRDLTVRFAGLTALDARRLHRAHPAPSTPSSAPTAPASPPASTSCPASTGPPPGSVRFGEHELTGLPPHRIAALGVARIFQNLALPPHATVEDSLLLGRHRLTRAGFLAAGLRLPSARARGAPAPRTRVREIAEFVGLEAASSTGPRARSRTGSRSSSNSPARCAWNRGCCSSTSRSPA